MGLAEWLHWLALGVVGSVIFILIERNILPLGAALLATVLVIGIAVLIGRQQTPSLTLFVVAGAIIGGLGGGLMYYALLAHSSKSIASQSASTGDAPKTSSAQTLENTPLDVELKIATPGFGYGGRTLILMTSHEPNAIRGAKFRIINVLTWHEGQQQYIETPDLYSEPFVPRELGIPDLFSAQSINIGFVGLKDSTVRITGPAFDAEAFCQFAVDVRIRRVEYLVIDLRGHTKSGFFCLKDNIGTDCPPFIRR